MRLSQFVESLAVEPEHDAALFGHGACAGRSRIEQRNLAEVRAGLDRGELSLGGGGLDRDVHRPSPTRNRSLLGVPARLAPRLRPRRVPPAHRAAAPARPGPSSARARERLENESGLTALTRRPRARPRAPRRRPGRRRSAPAPVVSGRNPRAAVARRRSGLAWAAWQPLGRAARRGWWLGCGWLGDGRRDRFGLGRGGPRHLACHRRLAGRHDLAQLGRCPKVECSTSMTEFPSRSVEPSVSVTGVEICSPLTKVPFVEPRSSTTTPRSTGRTTAWRRETSSSARVRSAPSRPITTSCSTSSDVPAAGPEVTFRALTAPRYGAHAGESTRSPRCAFRRLLCAVTGE